MSLPEGLHLVVDGESLTLYDAQVTVRHIDFHVGAGDPTDWSRSLVTKTCEALGVTAAWDADSDEDDGLTIGHAITRWHNALGAEDGFLP